MPDKADDIVERYAAQIADDRIFFAPHIPPDRLGKAISAYAKDARADEARALVDDSITKNAKDGALLTQSHLYAHNMLQKAVSVALSDVNTILLRFGKTCDLHINGKQFLFTSYPGKDAMRLFAQMLQEIVIALSREGADEHARAQWQELRRSLLESLGSAPASQRAQILTELDMLSGKLAFDGRAQAEDWEQRVPALAAAKASKGKEAAERAQQLAALFMNLNNTYRALGLEKEAVRARLRWIAFCESHTDDLPVEGTGDMPDLARILGGLTGSSEGFQVGWASGQAQIQRQAFVTELRQERTALLQEGKIKALGYCRACGTVYAADTSLRCPASPKHKTLRDVVYVIPEDAAGAERELRKKLGLPQDA